MLARRLTTSLQAMTLAEALEPTRLHSVAGRTGDRTAFVTTRPFRAPHHTLPDVGLIGGGPVPMPGEGFSPLSHPTAAAERPLRCDNAVLPSLQLCVGDATRSVHRVNHLLHALL